jgi:hypothetical protein
MSEQMPENEWWRWIFGIGSLLALALVLFGYAAVRHSGVIFVGIFLTIFQVACWVIFFLLFAAAIVLCLLAVFWATRSVLDAIANSEARIKGDLEALRKTLLRATNKFGADFLALVTGILAYPIQESIATYPEQYKIAICILFTVNFFLASQLIGSQKRSDKILGIIFFVIPVALFAISALAFVTPSVALSWLRNRSVPEVFLMSLVLFSVALTFVFAFLKQREV